MGTELFSLRHGNGRTEQMFAKRHLVPKPPPCGKFLALAEKFLHGRIGITADQWRPVKQKFRRRLFARRFGFTLGEFDFTRGHDPSLSKNAVQIEQHRG